jgi:hypothetical protein
MAFFKTAQEKEIEAQMERDEQLQAFDDRIQELKGKLSEYAELAARAEISGDADTYQTACNAMIELNEVISTLTQTKANFDVINVYNSVAVITGKALSALDAMSGNNLDLVDIRKVQKVNAKVSKYMKNIKISQKAMGNAMRMANPANKARSAAEIDSVRPLIDAARAKMVGTATPKASGVDLSADIEAERSKTSE